MNSARSLPLRYLALPAGAALIWAVNQVVTKMAADVIEPAAIGFYRWLLAGLVLTPFLARGCWRERHAIRQQIGRLAILGALGMALYQGLSYVAATTTSATNMGIITSLIPLLTLGIGVLVLRERPHIAAALGAALSLTGIAVLIGEGDPRRLLDVGVTQGDGLMLIAAAAYALYGVLLRKWAMPVSAWSSLYVQIVFGVLFQLPGFLLAPSSPLNSANLPMVLYAAVFPSLFAPYLWMRGIHYLGPQRASVFLNLMPFATAAIAATVLGEMLHAYHVIGGLMTMGGVMLAQRRT